MSVAKSIAASCAVLLLVSCGSEPPPPSPPSSAIPAGEDAGDVIGSHELADVDPTVAAAASGSTLVTYSSHYAVDDSLRHVTTSVYVPAVPPPPDGYPVVALARTIDGTGAGCGPSNDTAPTITALLANGYVVTVPDYRGFGRPSDGQSNVRPFLDSDTAARNVTDAVRAARNVVPNTSALWVAMGTGLAGQAAWAANELADNYGYGLNLRGTIAMSPTADVDGLAEAAAAGTLTPEQALTYIAYLDALAKAYPDQFHLDGYRRGSVARNWDLLLSCGPDSAAQRSAVLAEAAPDELRPADADAVAALHALFAKTVLPQGPTLAPMYVAYGDGDPLVPAAWTDRALVRACAMGDAIAVRKVPGDGPSTIDPRSALGWIADRFADLPAPNDCGQIAAETPTVPDAEAPTAAQPAPPPPDPVAGDSGSRGHGVSLIDGWLPIVVQILAAAVVLIAVGWRTRRWRMRWVPVGVLVGIGVAGLCYWYVDLQGWGHESPLGTWVWLAVTGLAVAVVFLGWRDAPWWRRAAAVVSVPLAALCALVVLNASLGYLPAVRTAWERAIDAPPPDIVDEATLAAMVRDGVRPASGTVVSIETPSTSSGFTHRKEFVYLPPAWFASSPPPPLPVVMMIGAELSNPSDWLQAGNARKLLDGYAREHRGMAPVAVFPDSTGSFANDTECVNGPRGNAAEHLTKDVRPYVVSRFGVDSNPARWAVLGWSTGGTCALTLTVKHPELFATAVDLDGQLGPNAGNHAQTVARLFGGDEEAWAAFDPKSIVRAHGRYDGTSLWVGVSGETVTAAPPSGSPPTDDELGEWNTASEDRATTATQLCRLLSGYGIDCSVSGYPGAHDFPSASHGFEAALPWLAGRLGVSDG